MKMKNNKNVMIMVVVECGVRFGAVVTLLVAACLVGLNSETELVLFIRKRVTYKDLNSFIALVYVDIAAAAYNLSRLVITLLLVFIKRSKRSSIASSNHDQLQLHPFKLILYWVCFFLDQVGVYVTFAATTAALVHSSMVMSGERELEWLKWCNKFTRFCIQIGAALFSSFLASILMAILSFLSSFHLFTLYSPHPFLLLKSSLHPSSPY